MSWGWSWDWRVYFGSLIICTLALMYARITLNDVNIAQYGSSGDFRKDPKVIFKSVLVAAVFAAMITVVVGATV